MRKLLIVIFLLMLGPPVWAQITYFGQDASTDYDVVAANMIRSNKNTAFNAGSSGNKIIKVLQVELKTNALSGGGCANGCIFGLRPNSESL